MFLTRRKGTEAELAKHPATRGHQADLFGADAPPGVAARPAPPPKPAPAAPPEAPHRPPRPRRRAPPEPAVAPSLARLAADAGRAELDEVVAALSDDALAHLALRAVQALRRRAERPARGRAAGGAALGRTVRLLAEEVSGMLGGEG